MVFRNDAQRKAVMAKLRIGNEIYVKHKYKTSLGHILSVNGKNKIKGYHVSIYVKPEQLITKKKYFGESWTETVEN